MITMLFVPYMDVLIADSKVMWWVGNKRTVLIFLILISSVMLVADDIYPITIHSYVRRRCSMENKSSSPKPMNGEGLYNKVRYIINK